MCGWCVASRAKSRHPHATAVLTLTGQARGIGMRKCSKILGAFSMSLASLLGEHWDVLQGGPRTFQPLCVSKNKFRNKCMMSESYEWWSKEDSNCEPLSDGFVNFSQF